MICMHGRIKVFVPYNVDSCIHIFMERIMKKANREKVADVGKGSAQPCLQPWLSRRLGSCHIAKLDREVTNSLCFVADTLPDFELL